MPSSQFLYTRCLHTVADCASLYRADLQPQAHPECELGGEKFLATEVTDPDDYARVYGLAEHVYAGWSDYRLKTDPIGRHIPVFRLNRASSGVDCDTRPPTARKIA